MGVGHRGNRNLLGLPDAVIGDQNIEAAELIDRPADQGAAVFRSGEFLGEGRADLRSAAFGHQGLGSLASGAVVEGHAGAGLAKEPNEAAPMPRDPPVTRATFPSRESATGDMETE